MEPQNARNPSFAKTSSNSVSPIILCPQYLSPSETQPRDHRWAHSEACDVHISGPQCPPKPAGYGAQYVMKGEGELLDGCRVPSAAVEPVVPLQETSGSGVLSWATPVHVVSVAPLPSTGWPQQPLESPPHVSL